MNTNIILDGFNAIINQLIATAVAEAIKPLQDRITALEEAYTDWKGMEHVAAKAVQPMLNRIVALEFDVHGQNGQNTLNEAVRNVVIDTFDVHGQNTLNEAVRNVLDGYNFISRNDVVDLVDKVVENAIDNYDFSDIIDWDNKVEEGINNYDFSDIIAENMPDELDKDVVQQMIDESLDNLSISRN